MSNLLHGGGVIEFACLVAGPFAAGSGDGLAVWRFQHGGVNRMRMLTKCLMVFAVVALAMITASVQAADKPNIDKLAAEGASFNSLQSYTPDRSKTRRLQWH